jgi:hypothetical protein
LHEKAKHLTKEQVQAFNNTTAQLLFLSHVRCYIQTTIAFLTTPVKQPDKDDWGKLKKVLKYLNSTHSLRLTLFADSFTNIHWYLDASHQTHKDCKGHTGSLYPFGKGAAMSSSNIQKIPCKSSTESEIIGLYNKTSNILWTHNFLKAQGYANSTNIVYQDNMSTLLFAKNGYGLSSKCTKHIKSKYFFICHYHNTHKLDLQYCPTKQMWADVLTKPLQGPKFQSMHAFLMNCPIDYSKEPPFIPSPNPTLAPKKLTKPTSLPKIFTIINSLSYSDEAPNLHDHTFIVGVCWGRSPGYACTLHKPGA